MTRTFYLLYLVIFDASPSLAPVRKDREVGVVGRVPNVHG